MHTTRRRTRLTTIALALLLSGNVVASGTAIAHEGHESDEATPAASPAAAPYAGLPFTPPPVVSGEENATYTGATLGDPDAPVTMAIYADYQCPHCGGFHRTAEPRLIDDFVRTGEVKLEFREFPFFGGDDLTDDGNESAQAAEALLCAAEQGAYLDYRDALYDGRLGINEGGFSDDRLARFAGDLGMDVDAFATCLASGGYEPAITQSRDEGLELGVTGTPMFIINGKVTPYTAQGYDLLRTQLEDAVAAAG
ncbi:MAG TPA: thioredoxin domain-containing protein [Thermomicrobiales bacterium]|nr:thioredoxin domain-containing protein [Thermomicrobiales bacterium]